MTSSEVEIIDVEQMIIPDNYLLSEEKKEKYWIGSSKRNFSRYHIKYLCGGWADKSIDLEQIKKEGRKLCQICGKNSN